MGPSSDIEELARKVWPEATNINEQPHGPGGHVASAGDDLKGHTVIASTSSGRVVGKVSEESREKVVAELSRLLAAKSK